MQQLSKEDLKTSMWLVPGEVSDVWQGELYEVQVLLCLQGYHDSLQVIPGPTGA